MAARTLSFVVALLFGFIVSPLAQGAQYQVRTGAGPKVVHTRIAPVLVHRLLPPFHGRHVYQGRWR